MPAVHPHKHFRGCRHQVFLFAEIHQGAIRCRVRLFKTLENVGGAILARFIEYLAWYHFKQISASKIIQRLLDSSRVLTRLMITILLHMGCGYVGLRITGTPEAPGGFAAFIRIPAAAIEFIAVTDRLLDSMVSYRDLVRQVQHQIPVFVVSLLKMRYIFELKCQVITEGTI